MRTALFCLWIVFSPAMALSAGSPLRLGLGESKLLEVEPSQKAFIADPSVAGIDPISDREILVTGRSPGNTDLTLVLTNGSRVTRAIIVSARNLKRTMVEISVEIMELETQSALKAGLSWGSLSGPVSGAAPALQANNVTLQENDAPPLMTFGSVTRQALSASLQLLVSKGKARILAKPKLLVVSGEEASFLAGGEVPYVMESKLGSPNIEWKPYGVKLQVKPSIDGEGNISAHFRAEVSGLDTQKGISLGPSVVPALRTRWAETMVYMRGGSTMVIAGLINEESQKFTAGVPILSDIPILGELFRFTDSRKVQTELVVFVTPTLIGRGGE
jgi:pilus assembly protein CpaC